ncbi:hypothetical protein [Microbacterium sp. A1-JK]|uniref:hypothetical protein n=1 Tax=Microbacterium sp. A1-JK TaxID=3177516 RepID=UPI00388A3C96
MSAIDFTITTKPYRDRIKVDIERGMYVTSFDVTAEEAEALIEVLRDALDQKGSV